MNAFAELLSDNLKVLNAKERDHLMRFAYLGVEGEYGSGTQSEERWLSEPMLVALSPLVPDNARCIFAGMDYHLDWFYAALSFAQLGKKVRDHEKVRGGARMHWIDERPCPWPTYESSELGRTLLPVTGLNEDIDLLAVFEKDASTTILCIEAKGDSSFDKVQMARKIIRLDRILAASGLADSESVSVRYVLCAPEDKLPPRDMLDECKYVLSGKKSWRFEGMERAFEHHRKGWGLPPALVPLKGFPGTLSKVMRVDESGKKDAKGDCWRIVRRRKPG